MRHGIGCWKKRTGDGGRASDGHALAVLNLTMLSPALPAIMSDFGCGCHTAQWLTSVYALVEAVVIPLFRLPGRSASPPASCSSRRCRCSRRAASPRLWRRTGCFCSGASCRPLARCGHTHGVHGDSARVPPREARYGHGRHRTHHRLRAPAVGPSLSGLRWIPWAGARCSPL